MFCVVEVQVEVVTLIIPALTKCSVWWVQVEVVTLIILALTKCSVWWEYR